MSYQKMITTTTTAVMIAAGLLFSVVPTITGLSFADDGSAAPTTTTGSDQKSGSDSSSSSSSSPQTSDQQQQQPTKQGDDLPTKGASGPCEAQQCDKEGKPMSCSPHCYPPINWPKFPVKVIVHHDTKVIHESSSNNNGHQLTVAQRNCMYGALQLGFSSNAQNRVDATYAAMMGCLNQQQ